VISTHVVDLGLVYHRPYPRLLQMLNLILVRRRQIRAHGPMMSRNNHPTLPCRLLLVHTVLDVDTLLRAHLAQRVGGFVVAHTADIPDGIGWEHVGGSTGRILSGSTGDNFGIAVLDELVVYGHVLGFSEDGVVEFKAVLLEHGVIADGDAR